MRFFQILMVVTATIAWSARFAFAQEVTLIPYSLAGQLIVDTMGGQIQGNLLSAPTTMPHVRSGRLRALA